MKDLNPKVALENNLTDIIIDHYKIGSQINQFLKDALQG